MSKTVKFTLLLYYRNCLLRTLRHCAMILEHVKSKGVEVRFHGRGKNEASHYCGQCEVSSVCLLAPTQHKNNWCLKLQLSYACDLVIKLILLTLEPVSWNYSKIYCDTNQIYCCVEKNSFDCSVPFFYSDITGTALQFSLWNKMFHSFKSILFFAGGSVQHLIHPRTGKAARCPLSGLFPQTSSQSWGLCLSWGVSHVRAHASLRQLCSSPSGELRMWIIEKHWSCM